MKENRYDDPEFFQAYRNMPRSQEGLSRAGEWSVLKELLPDLKGKTVLDLGCGYGWHCRYAVEKGASHVTGIDISEKMLARAREINNAQEISYEQMALEDAVFAKGHFDVVFSSLAIHYVKCYDELVQNIYSWLKVRGSFVFSVEHPIFTAQGKQDWIYDDEGDKLCWPVDNYFIEGKRDTVFLGERVVKYHRTLTGYLGPLINVGFKIKQIAEPLPNAEMLEEFPEMRDELRRPMMLLVAVEK